MDGEVTPTPKEVSPIVQSILLSGKGDIAQSSPEPDLARYRIERMLTWGRVEPEFWPVPPLVRVVGVKGDPVYEGTDKTGLDSYRIERRETAGDRPMTVVGGFTIHTKTGIMVGGKWTIANAPMPGGDDLYDLDVTVKTVRMDLAPRKD